MIKKLGDFLKERQLVEEAEIAEAVQLAKQRGKKLGQVLLENGALTEEDLLKAIGDQLGFNIVSLANYPIDPEVAHLISREICEERLCVPLKLGENNSLHVAMKDVSNADLVQYLKFSTGKNIVPCIALESEIRAAIGRLHDFAASLEDLVANISDTQEMELLDPERDADASEARSYSITQIVKTVLAEAVTKGASDIHMEPSQNFLRVRIRIDGQLQPLINIPKWVQSQVIGCIKVQASLNIAEKRLPQDGKMSANISKRHVDFRVSTLPTPQGEKVVIRIQDKGNKGYALAALKLPPYLLKQILRLLQNDKGIILVTGPTGSGKTTLLYSMLTELARRGPNIITVEDPIEYEFEGVTQTQINEKAGMTFSTILRSILRQDPNVIMIGEIRDQETAEIAFRAAQTGHLVLSTLHTNSAVSVVQRLKDLGIEPFLIASTVLGIFAQRLVRCNCPQCVAAEDTTRINDPTQKKLLEMLPPHTVLKRGEGCPDCADSGYKGRIGVYEFLRFSPGVVDAVNAGLPEKQILQAARADGMKTLVDECARLISEGTTSFAECSGILATLDMSEAGLPVHDADNCPNCHKHISPEFVVCPWCQYRLASNCPNCNGHVERDWKVCPFCSTRLENEPQPAAPSLPPPAPPPAAKPLVLVVDQMAAMRRALNIILAQIGCEVVESANGREALDIAANILPNLVIADADAPHLNGSRLFHALRDKPETAHIPFVLLTQGNETESGLTALLGKIDDHLAKPFNYRELQAKVRKLLPNDTLTEIRHTTPPVPVVEKKPAAPVAEPRATPSPSPARQTAPAVEKKAAAVAAAKPSGKPPATPPAPPKPAQALPLQAPAVPGKVRAHPAKSQVTLHFVPTAGDAPEAAYFLQVTPARLAPVMLEIPARDKATASKGKMSATLALDAAGATLTVTGLVNGKAHAFSLSAHNRGGRSASCEPLHATPAGLADAPTIIAVRGGDGQATLEIGAPSSHGGSPVSGYTVHCQPPGGRDAEAGSLATVHTVAGLSNGSSYTFTVVAHNGVGDSPASPPSPSVIPLAAPAQPQAAVVASDGRLLAILNGEENRGAPVQQYLLKVDREGSEPVSFTLDAVGGSKKKNAGLSIVLGEQRGRKAIAIDGLSNGVACVVSLWASNRAGESAPLTLTATPATVPQPPAILAVKAHTGEVEITLEAAKADGGAPISGYTVLSDPPGGTDREAGTLTLQRVISGLDPATPYTFSAVTHNSVGKSTPSAASAPLLPALPPEIGEVHALAARGQVSLRFAVPPGLAPQAYGVEVLPARGEPQRLALKAAPGASATEGAMAAALALSDGMVNIVVHGLVNGKAHQFRIFAANRAGQGHPSAPVSATPAGTPTPPTITKVVPGDGSATVTFSAPTSHGGSFITGYAVYSEPPHGSDLNAGSRVLTHRINGLHNGTQYRFTVVAHNAIGDSQPSAPSGGIAPLGSSHESDQEHEPVADQDADNWLAALEGVPPTAD